MKSDSFAEKKNGSSSKPIEKLEISSGKTLIIDQHILGNKQFLDKISLILEDSKNSDQDLEACLSEYGGCLYALQKGSYEVFRDPYEKLMLVFPEGQEEQVSYFLDSDEEYDFVSEIFVDTRCLVFADSSLLQNKELLGRYSSLRAEGEEKSARDLLREHGATVRYGFSARPQSLGTFEVKASSVLALWPE